MSERYTTIGVTGHIDHGKTTLVRALTGHDTDTHPEEKRRGITIDLGFAALATPEHTFAFIDAPGHQKYVGNLLAGVSAVDVGLLVVACDQGIQEQTLEHAAILQTLHVPQLVVALSRIDLCDAQRRAEITEEIEVFLADYGYEQIPIIPVSSVDGTGIEDLKQQLIASASIPKQTTTDALPFRLPIDRVLNVPGRGLVVAGTIWNGHVAVGDSLSILGRSDSLRVRELEVHGQSVQQSSAGMRTAINLVGHNEGAIRRGDELIAEDYPQPSSRFLVALEAYPSAKELRCPATVTLHTATTSVSVRLSGPRSIAAGSRKVVVLDASEPLLMAHGQACLLRLPYPVGSFAGGRVLAALESARSRTADLLRLGEQLTDTTADEKIMAWMQHHGRWDLDQPTALFRLGIPAKDVDRSLAKLEQDGEIVQLDGQWIHPALFERVSKFLKKLLVRAEQEQQDAWIIEDSLLQQASGLADANICKAALRELAQAKEIVSLNGRYAIASERTQLSKKQRQRIQELLAMYESSRTPPTAKEASAQLDINIEAAISLIRYATEQGILLDLGQGFFIGAQPFTQLCTELKKKFTESPQLTVAEIRDLWQMTRKHAIPLLEYCDKHAITMRDGDTRAAGAAMDSHCIPTEAGDIS